LEPFSLAVDFLCCFAAEPKLVLLRCYCLIWGLLCLLLLR